MARRCSVGSNGPIISESTAIQIERRAREMRAKYKTRAPHMALTYAATEILGCQPRRAIAGEGSLNYFRAIGRFHWDGSGERAAREAAKSRHGLRFGASGRSMTDLSPELIEVTDYLHTATNLRPLVTGKKANRILGIGGEWRGKVVGDDPDGAQVTVAWYDHPYEQTAEAKRRAAQLLKYVKSKR